MNNCRITFLNKFLDRPPHIALRCLLLPHGMGLVGGKAKFLGDIVELLFSRLLQVFSEFFTKGIVTHFPFNAGAGIHDCSEIPLIGKNAVMKGPLSATPWFAGMDRTSLIRIENTVTVHRLHLHHTIRYPQKLIEHILPRFAEIID